VKRRFEQLPVELAENADFSGSSARDSVLVKTPSDHLPRHSGMIDLFTATIKRYDDAEETTQRSTGH
jgi:acetaldehyde dehydrogenase (acetylating)